MSLRRLLLPILLLLFSSLVYAEENGEDAILQQLVTQTAFVEKNSNDIWPGFALKPVVLLFTANKHVYAFNHFQPIAASWYQWGQTYYDTWQKYPLTDLEIFKLPNDYNNTNHLDS